MTFPSYSVLTSIQHCRDMLTLLKRQFYLLVFDRLNLGSHFTATSCTPRKASYSGPIQLSAADWGNHFLVAAWAVAAASGIVIASQRRSSARSKSVRCLVRNKKLCLDLGHVSLPSRREH